MRRATRATTATSAGATPRPASSGSSGRAAGAPVTTARTAPRTPPGRTPQATLRTHLLAILADHGDRLERDQVMAQLERRMAQVLTRQDRAVGPSGEVRWRTAVLRERRAMQDDGLLVSGGPGVWQLTAQGQASLQALRAAYAAAQPEEQPETDAVEESSDTTED